MMRRMFMLLAGLVLASAATPVWAQGSEGQGVLASYESLRDALARGNGTAAADLASDESIALFGRLRDLSLKGSKMQVGTLPPAQRFMVLRMRLKFGRAIAGMDGKALLSAAAAQGMIGESLPSPPSLADIAIQGTRATATVRAPEGRQTPYKLAFAKQRGGWRVDIGPLLSIADDEFRRAAREDKVSENQLIEQLIGLLSPGGSFDAALWEPVAPGAGDAPKPAPVPNQAPAQPPAKPAAKAPGNPPPAPPVPPPAVIVPPSR